MGDPRDVLAKDARVLDWLSVFREDDGWVLDARLLPVTTIHEFLGARKDVAYCGPTASGSGSIAVSKDDVVLRLDGTEVIGYVGNHGGVGCGPTLGELLDIANELAATRFCGGWK